ncbi:MAG: hypothetical protein LQ345_002569, partial [Seirophora villosa]
VEPGWALTSKRYNVFAIVILAGAVAPACGERVEQGMDAGHFFRGHTGCFVDEPALGAVHERITVLVAAPARPFGSADDDTGGVMLAVDGEPPSEYGPGELARSCRCQTHALVEASAEIIARREFGAPDNLIGRVEGAADLLDELPVDGGGVGAGDDEEFGFGK